TGNNSNGGSAGKFVAISGYDLCTGWGSPAGSRLISALIAPPNALQITPAAPVASSGPVGGPFSPNAQTYGLTNAGPLPLAWALVNTSAWLNISATNGTLPAAGPAETVLLSLNSA